MKERPILFSGPMVRAILDGRKTMTRRVIKNVPGILLYPQVQDCGVPIPELIDAYKKAWLTVCPHGQPGDRLWVRETFATSRAVSSNKSQRIESAFYRADEGIKFARMDNVVWRPSIFMPRWASRLTLEIAAVRVERIWAITGPDCLAEGVSYRPNGEDFLGTDFHKLWDSLNSKRGYGWDANPWVWAISFKRVE
jgi:hypothetical protein